MCCQANNVTVRPSWCVSVQEAARRSAEWLVGWLPCLKVHRIHPTVSPDPESSFVALDSKKQIRVLHLYPKLGDAVLLSRIKSSTYDNVDAGDPDSSDAAGDYWFMRWNRPLRTDFQRNSCSCSFRKSNSKHIQESDIETKQTIATGNIAPVISRKTEKIVCQNGEPDQVNKDGSLSQGIAFEDSKQNPELGDKNCRLPTLSDSPEYSANNSANYCDIDIKEIQLSFKEAKNTNGGYINPVFLGSTDSLDSVVQSDSLNTNCDNASNFDKWDGDTVKHNRVKNIKECGQDHNANDPNQQTLEDNIQVRSKEVVVDNSDTSKKTLGRIKHRKYCKAGPKAYLKKPLLFMIHGAGSNAEVWRSLIYQMVHAGFECVAPDILGHGLSSAPDSAGCYTFHSLLQDLLGIFDRYVTGGRRAVIIGHGYGCSIAAAMTRYRAEQVIQLVLISGGGPTPLAPRKSPSVSPCLRCCLEPLLMCGFKRDVVYSVCGKQIEPCSPEECAMPRHILEHIAQGHVWPEGDAAFHRRIVSPTLLVHGMKDQHVTLVQQCEMERTIPRSFLEIIPEAGHWAMLETPDHLSHMILCFINWWAPTNLVS